MPCPETEPVDHPSSMAIIRVIDVPTWLAATAGVCVFVLLVWHGQTQTARRDSVAAPEDEDGKWHVVGEGRLITSARPRLSWARGCPRTSPRSRPS